MKTGKPLRMERQFTGLTNEAAKESVAAHQATCLCHEIIGDAETEQTGEQCLICRRPVKPDARDVRGHHWHVDPLCKVRPEARC